MKFKLMNFYKIGIMGRKLIQKEKKGENARAHKNKLKCITGI